MQNREIQRQKGAALLVSLIILLVMAIIGVSALANTGLEERMAQNFQHTTLAFQAAESAIQEVIVIGDAGGTGAYDNPFYVKEDDPLLTALDAGLDDTSTVVTYDADPYDHLKNTDLSSSSTVVYKNDGYCPGTSTDVAICYYYDVTATATISATSTKATHVQGLGRPAPNPDAG